MECFLVNEVRWKAWRFGKEVVGGCYGSWADDCASDEQSALNNSDHSVHSVSVILKGVVAGWERGFGQNKRYFQKVMEEIMLAVRRLIVDRIAGL